MTPPPPDTGLARLLRALTWPFRVLITWLLALVILFEEWGWEPLQRALSWVVKRLGLARLGDWLTQLPPYAALVSLALPSLLLIPFKLAAFALIARGHAVLGAALFITAKLVGTAVIARIFNLVRPQLMQLAWFARLYTAWKSWKDGLLARVRESRLWQSLKRSKERWRARIRAAWAAWKAK